LSWFRSKEKESKTGPSGTSLASEIRQLSNAPDFSNDYQVPVVAKVVVGDSVDFQNMSKEDSFGGIVFWSNTKPKIPTISVVNHFSGLGILPKKNFCVIAEYSKDDVAIRNMHKFIHAIKPSVFRHPLAGRPNTLVCIDPKHELPILVRMAWPKTRIVCIFTKLPVIQSQYLSEIDCIISCSSIVDRFPEKEKYPIFHTAGSIESMEAHIKAFHSVVADPKIPFLYSVKGRQYDAETFEDYDVILVERESTRNLNETSTFRQYIEAVMSDCEDILISSKWLYRLENYVSDKNWKAAIMKILSEGGSIGNHTLQRKE
jgi:hypothetical protein